MESEILRLAPFHHDIELPHGLRTCPPETVRRPVQQRRLQEFVSGAFPALAEACGGSLQGLRVLDVGCSCGGFSLAARGLGAEYVLGVDVVERYTEQANFIKAALGITGVEFRTLSAESLDAGTLGVFDVVLCLGLLYHLANPVATMEKIASLTKRVLLLDSHVLPTWLDRRPLWLMNVRPASSLTRRPASTSLWRETDRVQFKPTVTAVVALLRFLGFKDVRLLAGKRSLLRKPYRRSRRATFLAAK